MGSGLKKCFAKSKFARIKFSLSVVCCLPHSNEFVCIYAFLTPDVAETLLEIELTKFVKFLEL